MPADFEAITALNIAAFASSDEAEIIAHLRVEGSVIVSLVADDAGEIAGHILFSELPIESGDTRIKGAALAPMAVAPARQRQGIGSRLVEDGLETCRNSGIEAVVVLGHPDYYPRFGFSAETARHLKAPFSGPAFMALELVPGILDGVEGTVHYADAFGLNGT
jgi:putative acetyltransferase